MPKIAKTDYQLRLSVRPSILFSAVNGNTFVKIFRKSIAKNEVLLKYGKNKGHLNENV